MTAIRHSWMSECSEDLHDATGGWAPGPAPCAVSPAETLQKEIDTEVYRGLLRGTKAIALDEENFEEEVRLLSRFRHPNLVCLLGWATSQHEQYLIYEFLAGGDLHHHLELSKTGAPFAASTRVSAAFQAACGLSYMVNSTPKAFHRDIKPANILLDRNGTAKMVDFGLSGTVKDHQAHLTVDRISGTPGYACPFYIQTGQVSERSEVYSFGTVLLELIVNQPPALMDERGSIVYPMLQTIQPASPGALDRVLKHAEDARWSLLQDFAALALKCVDMNADRRPLFEEVVTALRRISGHSSARELRIEASHKASGKPDKMGAQVSGASSHRREAQVAELRLFCAWSPTTASPQGCITFKADCQEACVGRQHQPEFFERLVEKESLGMISRTHFKICMRPTPSISKLSANPMLANGVPLQQGSMMPIHDNTFLSLGSSDPAIVLCVRLRAPERPIAAPCRQRPGVAALHCVKSICTDVQQLPQEAKMIVLACGRTMEADETVDKVQSILGAFQRYDANGDGVIDFTELGALMRGLAGSAAEWEDCQIRALLKAMDSNNDGKVVLTEFGAWLFGTQLTPEDASKLEAAEQRLTPKVKGKAASAKGAAKDTAEDTAKDPEKATKAAKATAKGMAKSNAKSNAKSEKDEEAEGEDDKEGDEDEGEDEDEEGEDEGEEGEDAEEDECDECDEGEEGDEAEEGEDDGDDESLDAKELYTLSQASRSAVWTKLMPAREGSAQDAAERMKSLKPPNPKRAGDHKHVLLYLQNHAGGRRDVDGEAPPGADRDKALRWLKDAMLKISEAHEKSYALPVKWLIGNWRLWPDPGDETERGFVELKSLAVKKLDVIGKKYEEQYRERKLGQELGLVGEGAVQVAVRPRQDHYITPPEGFFGLKELQEKELRRMDAQEKEDAEEEHERKKQTSFIVLLLTAVHAVDHLFQDTAREICESVGGTARAPPPKGFMRMWAKLDTDHAKAKSPRAAENIDTNRVAWIFEEPEQLRAAFDKAQKVFGHPVRVKNGYDPGFDAMTETKGYRNILANYHFSPGLTWGQLGGDTETAGKTRAAWDKFRKLLVDTFLNMGYVDEAGFDEELTYYMHCCDAAKGHLSSSTMKDEPMELVVEIQYMLASYFDMRKYTHTWYKIVRAENPEALVVDYNS
ncbi:unnamed protein product [Effrenium voratum]|nr:unnamed protein product [Effrenium voratum]